MDNNGEDKKDDEYNISIPTIILNVVFIFVAIYIFILYVKDKNFHTVPCYNMIIITLLLFFDNVLRIIPVGSNDIMQYIQAFILVFFDKVLLNILTIQAIIYYLGVIKTQIYYANEKVIYITSFVINLIIGIILASIYIIANGKTKYGIYWYCGDSITNLKKIIDSTFIGILIAINFFCILILLIYISGKKRKASRGEIEDLGYCHHFTRVLLMFFVNMLTFIEQYFIIYDVFDYNVVNVDLVYLSTCLIIDLFYTLNKTIYDETCVIFCHKTIKKPKQLLMEDTTSSKEDDEDEKVRSESWDIKV
jgi:hypothetical protein